MCRHQLLLIQTRTPALDTIQILVDLVRTVKCHIQQHALGQRVEGDGRQTRFDNDLAGLVARGHEADLRRVAVEGLDGFDDEHDCAAGANADEAGGEGEVVCYGAKGGVAFRGFDVGHFRGGRAEGVGGSLGEL